LLFSFLFFLFAIFSCFSPCPFSSLSPYCFFFLFMCVGTFSLEQEKDLKRHCNLLQGVGNFGFKQDHNATWKRVWNNKTCYKNAIKFWNFSNEFFFCFYFYFTIFFPFSFMFFLPFLYFIFHNFFSFLICAFFCKF
jgi:hypothetical protein